MTNQENQNQQNEEILENTTENTENIEEIPETLPDNEEIAKLREALARSQADYQNLVMRNERDRKDMIHFLTEKLISPILPQIDNLDRAVAIKDWVTDDKFVDGVRSVQSGLKKFLEQNNIIPFDSIGQEVDPNKHEVLSQMTGAEWIIIAEFEKWYMLGDRVFRHAKVIVGNWEE